MSEIVIYTDASFDGLNTKIGGWGFIWKRGNQEDWDSGACPTYIRDASTAELYAIVVAVAMVIHAHPDVRRLHVYTDSQSSLRWLADDLKEHHEVPAGLLSVLDELLGGRELIAEWIPGHTLRSDENSVYNARVDQLSRAARLRHAKGWRKNVRQAARAY